MLMVALTIVVGVNVFFRYILNNTLYWATELSIFLFIWIVFIGAAVAYSRNSHISVTLFLDKLNPKNKKIIDIINSLILISFLVFLTKTGYSVAVSNINSLSEAMKISYGLVYSVVPISCALMLLHTIASLINILKRR